MTLSARCMPLGKPLFFPQSLHPPCYFTCQHVEPECEIAQDEFCCQEKSNSYSLIANKMSQDYKNSNLSKILIEFQISRWNFQSGVWTSRERFWVRIPASASYELSSTAVSLTVRWLAPERGTFSKWLTLICNLSARFTAITYVPSLCCSSRAKVPLWD